MWPFAQQTDREREVWTRQWTRPQAVEWDRNGQHEEVALYVRTLCDAEALDASASVRTLAKQMQEALGLSLPGLLRLRWKIEATAPASTAKPLRRNGARDRFRVIDGGSPA